MLQKVLGHFFQNCEIAALSIRPGISYKWTKLRRIFLKYKTWNGQKFERNFQLEKLIRRWPKNGEIPFLPRMTHYVKFIRRGRVIEAFLCEQHLVNGTVLHWAFFAHKPLCTEAFAHKQILPTLLQADTFAYKCLGTQNFYLYNLLLYTHGLVQTKRLCFWFSKQEFLFTSTFFCTNNVTHTHGHFCWFSFEHRNIDTQRCFQRTFDTQTSFLFMRFFAIFFTQTLLDPEHFSPHKQHTNNLTPKPFHTDGFTKNAFAHTFFCQQTTLLHTKTISLLDAFLWRTEIYTHRFFHTQTRSHTDTCAYWRFDTQRAFYTQRRSEGPEESLVYSVIRFNN